MAARNTASLLRMSRYDLSVTDIPVEDHQLGTPHGFEDLQKPAYRGMPYGINILHAEPNILDERLARDWAFTPMEHRMNIIVPFWELSVFPRPWIPPLEAIDTVLAPSLHIKRVIEEASPETPVLHYPQSVTVPETAPDRTRWGFRPGETVFLTAFDALSDVERKNPLGSLAAFRDAFADRDDVRLVLRMKNADRDPRYAGSVRLVREAGHADSRVRIIEEPLPFDDLLSLYASADVLVSLHRAEGLGLVLMECMSLGTPVIATGWSGNMDFTDQSNSALVGYDMVPATGALDHYLPEYVGTIAEWAEPHLDEAATWMRALADDHALVVHLGAKAREAMRERRDLEGRLRVFDELAQLYEAGAIQTPRHFAAASYIRARRHEAYKRALSNPAKIVRGARRILGI